MTAPPRPTLRNVQRLRFLAAFGVLLSHMAATLIPPTADTGWFWAVPWTGGVDLFFVISGFIMALLSHDAFGQAHAARDFLVRRAVRIVPPYWFFTTLTILLVVAAGGRAGRTTVDTAQAVTSYAFLPWPGIDGQLKPIVSQGWTLNYEAFFYVAFAVALCTRRGFGLLCLALALLAAVHAWIPRDLFMIVFWSQPIILEFVAGMMLAQLYRREVRLPAWGSLACVLLAIGLFVVLQQVHGLDRALAVGVPATLVAAAMLLAPEPRGNGAIARLVERGGDASYTIYLAHYMITWAIGHAWARAGIGLPWLGVAIGVTVALVVSVAFFEIVERPVTAALRGRITHRRGTPLDTVAP